MKEKIYDMLTNYYNIIDKFINIMESSVKEDDDIFNYLNELILEIEENTDSIINKYIDYINNGYNFSLTNEINDHFNQFSFIIDRFKIKLDKLNDKK